MKLKKLICVITLFMIVLVVSMPLCYAVKLSLTYDANGNLVTGDGKYRVYNSLNQLYRVYNGSNSSGTLLYEFKYHPIEERVLVKKTYNASGNLTETVYYWSKNFITVVNASGSFNYTYVYHNGDLVAQQNPDGSKLFVLGDNKGSTSVITNGSGVVLERTTYSPFGEVLSGGRLNRYGYEGKEQEMGHGKVLTDGLVSYYTFEGGAFDDGVGNQGTIINATLTTGKVRDGYSFDGSSDYIAINDSSSLDITSGLTLSAWIKPVEAEQGYVVAKYQSYMIQYRGSGGSNDTQGGIWIGGAWTALATSSTIPLNTWTHVVFTYNKSNAYIYINGALSGSGNNNNSIDTNNQIFCIGAKNATVHDRDFNGSIDEVGVWNRALTSTEVAQLYNYGGQFESGYRTTDFNARRFNLNTVLAEQPDTQIKLYDPQSLNRYMIERGNPINKKDPDGHNVYVARLLESNPVGWIALAVFGAGLLVYEGSLALREAYPPSELAEDIFDYGYARPRDALRRMMQSYLEHLDWVTENILKPIAETTIGNYEAQRHSSQDTKNPNAANTQQNVNMVSSMAGNYKVETIGDMIFTSFIPSNVRIKSYQNNDQSSKGISYSPFQGKVVPKEESIAYNKGWIK